MGEIVMGTEGAVEITVGDDKNPAIAWWYREPPKAETVGTPRKAEEHFVAGATMVAAGNGAAGPIPLMTTDMDITANDGFFSREVKFAKRWLYQKGVFVQEEAVNPADTELRSFFQNCRDGQRPRADLEVGLADAVAVILSNQAMDEGRKVNFSEIDKSKAEARKTE